MQKSIVFMFSGQGSQYFHMASELYIKHPDFKKWMVELDGIAGKLLGKSIIDVIYDGSKGKTELFNHLIYTHPAIFMVEYSLARLLEEEGIYPDFVLGSSLGEFAAAVLAGVVSIDAAMECIIKQAQIIEANCEKGRMLAIICKPELYDQPYLAKNCEMASVNYDSHFVVSCEGNKLQNIQKYLKESNITYQELPVTYAFHSSLINSAKKQLIDVFESKEYRKPGIPMVSGLYGKLVNQVPKDYFWNVIRNPIQFPHAIKVLESIRPHIYIDLGPSGTQANFAKYNLKKDSKSEVFSIISPFGQDVKNLNILIDSMKNKKLLRKVRSDNSMVAYVFPGQGSQSKGMGGELFDEFKEFTAIADRVLGYSIKQLCINDPQNQLGQTQFTQPALYVVNALSYLKKLKENPVKPDYVAGHSLGEYNALFAAGAFDFETGLRLVKKRGELMSQAEKGGMAAVVGFTSEKVEEILKNNNLNTIDIANYNTPTQIVISGPNEDIERAKPIFEVAGVRTYVILKVSGAFHSRYMNKARDEFAKFLEQFEVSDLTLPVISNVHARTYKNKDIKRNMIDQITSSVKWTEIIRYFMGKGDMEITQVGPGTVINGLVKTIQREAEPLVVNEPETEEVENDKATENTVIEQVAIENDKQAGVGIKSKKSGGSGRTKVGKKNTALENEEGSEKTVQAIKEEEKTPGKKNNETKISAKSTCITASSLGSEEFKKDYNLKYAYLTGGMYRGIASEEIVVKMGKAGMMGFFGTGGLELDQIEEAIKYIQKELDGGQVYGMNFLSSMNDPGREEKTVDLFMKYNINIIEAAAFISMTPALVKYRLTGLKRNEDSRIFVPNKIIAKVSRPEVAEAFLGPAPERIVQKLVEQGKVTKEEAELSKYVPMCDDLCVEADSGGHTDQGVAYVLMPAMLRLRDDMMKKFCYAKKVRVGAAGGIGTPEAAVAAFILGADFILTGSINQCTIEANTSDAVKDLLQLANVQDTDYAPAGDMFEMGAKVQVLKKGLFFSARANKLYDLYRQYNSLNEIDEKTRKQIQERYFKRSFDEIYEETKKFFAKYNPQEIEKAEQNGKHKMALVFRWYFSYSTRLALNGDTDNKVDYQVHCGPALGAFNQWVKGTEMENWKNRSVEKIANMIMEEAAKLLEKRISALKLIC